MYIKTDKKKQIKIEKSYNADFRQKNLEKRYVGGAVVVANEFDADGHNHTYGCVEKLAHDYLKGCRKLDLQHGDLNEIKQFLSNREGVDKYTTEDGKEIIGIDFEVLEQSMKAELKMKKSSADQPDSIGELEDIGIVVDCCFISEELVELIKNDEIKAGTFYLGTKVIDDEVLDLIKNEILTGFSVKGTALGREVEDGSK